MGWSATLLAMLCCGVLAAQDTTPAKPCKPKDASCTTTQNASDKTPSSGRNASSSAEDASGKPKSSSESFPFPVEDSRHGGDAEGATTPSAPTAQGNGLPPMPTAPTPDPPAESEKPMQPSAADADSSGSLPPGTSSSADDDSDVPPTSAAPNAPVKEAPLKNYGARDSDETIHAKLDKTRVPDDLKVGRYYLQSGNAMGAYLRFRDAVDHDGDDPDARFYLAEAAAQLKKTDEALQNYRECLKLDPGGDHDKAARLALDRLNASARK